MDDELDEIDLIQACCLIHVSYSCEKCREEIHSDDVEDTDGYSLAVALHEEGWRTVSGELLCERCAANKPEAT